LDALRRLLAQAPGRLRAGGRLLVEIGASQGDAARALAQAAFFDRRVRVQILPDLAGRDRVLQVDV
jgi:release factor glutamine methyltransferase